MNEKKKWELQRGNNYNKQEFLITKTEVRAPHKCGKHKTIEKNQLMKPGRKFRKLQCYGTI